MDLERTWGVAENGSVAEISLLPHLMAELQNRWPPCGLDRLCHPAHPVEARFGLSDEWVITPDLQQSGGAPSAEAWDMLEAALTIFAVSRLTRLVAVHSAAIAHHGRVMIVPAHSEGGKSTLAIAAADAGAVVLSDEYTLIDPDTGLVTGWRRPVRSRRSDGQIERLDLAVPSGPLPVGLVAAVSFAPDQGTTWRSVSSAEATAKLLSHTICNETRPGDALRAAVRVAQRSPAVAGNRPPAPQAILDLLEEMEKLPSRRNSTEP